MGLQRTALASLLLLALGANGELQILKSLRANQKPEQDAFEADMESNPDAARAEVYMPPSSGNPTMELVRFTTGFNTGIDAFVDVTPYTPLFMKPMGVQMYGSIEAHKKDHSGTRTIYYQPNPEMPRYSKNSTDVPKDTLKEELKTCTAQTKREGNGWLLSADLVFFKHTEEDPNVPRAAPREILALVTGEQSTHAIGAITMHGGVVTEKGDIVTQSPIDLTGVTDLVAYNCEDGEAVIKKAALGDYLTARAEKYYNQELKQKGNGPVGVLKGEIESVSYDDLQRVKEEVEKLLLEPHLVEIDPIHADALNKGSIVFGGQNVDAFFNDKEMTPEVGMPVFFEGSVYTEQKLYTGTNDDVTPTTVGVLATRQYDHYEMRNKTFPFKQVGKVLWVQGNKMGVKVDEACYPKQDNNYEVKLLMPRTKGEYDDVKDFIQSAEDLGKLRASVDFGPSETTLQQRFHLPDTDKFGTLKLPEVKPLTNQAGNQPGAVPLPENGKPLVENNFQFDEFDHRPQGSEKVCVVAARKSGRVIERKFNAPLMHSNDVAVLHIAVTGNGWEYTQEQCGEYCDIKYQLRINDHEPIDINQYRDDCAKNPNNMQKGDWYQARNGGCPGSVHPGTMADITALLNTEGAAGTAANTMSVDILVHDRKSGQYVPYTNVKGWLFGEEAGLLFSVSVHIYPGEIRSWYQEQTDVQICSESEHLIAYPGTKALGNLDMRSEVGKDIERPTTSLLQKLDESSLEYIDQVMQNPEAAKQVPAWAMKLMQATGTNVSARDKRCFDFQENAPFFPTAASAHDIQEKIDNGNAIRVPVLKKVHLGAAASHFTEPLNLMEVPFHWRQAGLQIKLESPEGEEYEHWPRTGSVGLEFIDSWGVRMHDIFDPSLHPGLEAGASRVGILGALLATLFALVA